MKKSPKEVFDITIKVGPREFKVQGATILEAFQKLPLVSRIILRGTITISKGKKTIERVVFPRQLSMIFGHSVIRKSMWAKMFTQIYG